MVNNRVRERSSGALLVRSGLVELAMASVTGWVMTVATTQPNVLRRIGVRDLQRIRQWHLDLAMLGTAAVAAGLGAPKQSRVSAVVLAIGTWTNAFSFLPLAFKPDLLKHPAYRTAAGISFALTTIGFVAAAGAATRTTRKS